MVLNNRDRQNPPLPSEQRRASAPRRLGVWLISGRPVRQPEVIWLKRPMPPDQWPQDPDMKWWVRAHCGHDNGARQFAFYEERYADVYEHVFRANPCWWTRCGSPQAVRPDP